MSFGVKVSSKIHMLCTFIPFFWPKVNVAFFLSPVIPFPLPRPSSSAVWSTVRRTVLMCTSWLVTPSSCRTSASQWPPLGPQAWPWPPPPAPPTAAPQTEPTPLNDCLTDLNKCKGGGGGRRLIKVPPQHPTLPCRHP